MARLIRIKEVEGNSTPTFINIDKICSITCYKSGACTIFFGFHENSDYINLDAEQTKSFLAHLKYLGVYS